MQKASKGISLTELIEELESNLVYGGAKRISEYEAELLDQLDDSFDNQLKLQKEVERTKSVLKRTEEELKITDDAIDEYCSETTRKKILLARGWQFMPEEADKINGALSDKDIFRLSFQQIGKGTTSAIISNPEQANEAFKILENGVKIQEKIKEEGQTQGEG